MDILDLILLGIAAGMVNLTVTKSWIFREVRMWADEKGEKLGKLVSCPYCFGHWVGFVLTLVTGSRPICNGNAFFDWFLSSLVIGWLSVLTALVVFKAVKSIMEDTNPMVEEESPK